MHLTIGEKIKFYREKAGITQEELGARIGIPRDYAQQRIKQYEKGIRTPKKNRIDAIALALGVPAAMFYTLPINEENKYTILKEVYEYIGLNEFDIEDIKKAAFKKEYESLLKKYKNI